MTVQVVIEGSGVEELENINVIIKMSFYFWPNEVPQIFIGTINQRFWFILSSTRPYITRTLIVLQRSHTFMFCRTIFFLNHIQHHQFKKKSVGQNLNKWIYIPNWRSSYSIDIIKSSHVYVCISCSSFISKCAKKHSHNALIFRTNKLYRRSMSALKGNWYGRKHVTKVKFQLLTHDTGRPAHCDIFGG